MENFSIIKKYRTPLYVYDISELKRRVEMMRSHQSEIGLCYAMKAAPALAGYIAPYVDRLEVCSPGEYEICFRNHVPQDKIMVSGVNKTRDSIKRILSLGGAYCLFTIESMEHFNILEEAARCIPDIPRLRCFIRLTSGNQFGVDQETFEMLCQKVTTSDYLELEGIHYFSGTQKNLKKIDHELVFLAEYGIRLQERFGRTFKLEYGPGLGIDYFSSGKNTVQTPNRFSGTDLTTDKQSATDLSSTNEDQLIELMKLVETSDIRKSYSDITFEYGRYIAATCGTYYTSVADVKANDGTNYAILDGGLHQLTYYGSMSGMKVPPVTYIPADIINSANPSISSDYDLPSNSDTYIDYVLAGSLCSINDILARKISLPPLSINDVLSFGLAGAYCVTEGIALFLSRDLPAILIIDESSKELLIRDHMETNEYNG